MFTAPHQLFCGLYEVPLKTVRTRKSPSRHCTEISRCYGSVFQRFAVCLWPSSEIMFNNAQPSCNSPILGCAKLHFVTVADWSAGKARKLPLGPVDLCQFGTHARQSDVLLHTAKLKLIPGGPRGSVGLCCAQRVATTRRRSSEQFVF